MGEPALGPRSSSSLPRGREGGREKGAGPLLTVHPPDLDLPVVSPGYDEGHGGVEGGPVDATVVALKGKYAVRGGLGSMTGGGGSCLPNARAVEGDDSIAGRSPKGF